ncbi:4022_t:CDS:2 [Gigaspora rosea]|nr:4022_t:CDS:2 [Gigaspora rosea]
MSRRLQAIIENRMDDVVVEQSKIGGRFDEGIGNNEFDEGIDEFDKEINDEFDGVGDNEFGEVGDNEFGEVGVDEFNKVSDNEFDEVSYRYNEFDKEISTEEFDEGIEDEL